MLFRQHCIEINRVKKRKINPPPNLTKVSDSKYQQLLLIAHHMIDHRWLLAGPKQFYRSASRASYINEFSIILPILSLLY